MTTPEQPTTPYPPQRPYNPTSPAYGPTSPPRYPSAMGQPIPSQVNLQVQQPVTDKSKRFLNLSTGALVTVITAILLVCCIGPIALCFFGGFVGAVGEATKKAPTATVTDCQLHESSVLPSADITYTLKNNNSTGETYLVYFVVKNSSGSQVGTGSDFVDIGGGQSATKQTTVYLDASGGVSCGISSIS